MTATTATLREAMDAEGKRRVRSSSTRFTALAEPFRKWVMVLALALGSAPAFACEGIAAPVSSPFETQIVPAVLHLPGPGEEPLYSSVQFAEAPPIIPGNRCEAQCLTDFRRSELLLGLCAAACTDSV